MRYAVLSLLLLGACAHTNPSRWVDASGVHDCICDGAARAPTPSEASSSPTGTSIEAVCEGNVHDCGPYRGERSMRIRWDD